MWFTIAKYSSGIILVAALAVPACVSVNKSSDEQGSRTDTVVGGEHGVVAHHETGQGTDVTVGGNKGVVVQHESGQGTNVDVGGSKGVNVDQSTKPSQ